MRAEIRDDAPRVEDLAGERRDRAEPRVAGRTSQHAGHEIECDLVSGFGGTLCLVLSFRGATGRAERNQVQWILLASLIASLLIGYLLSQAWSDPLTLGRDSALRFE